MNDDLAPPALATPGGCLFALIDFYSPWTLIPIPPLRPSSQFLSTLDYFGYVVFAFRKGQWAVDTCALNAKMLLYSEIYHGNGVPYAVYERLL